MKKHFLIALALLMSFALQAGNKDYYQALIDAQIENFSLGYNNAEDFTLALTSLNELEAELTADPERFKEKTELLLQIQSLKAFIGEISPDPQSHSLTLTQKDIAMSLLSLTDELYDSTGTEGFCLPIKRMSLWNDKYIAYMINNKSDTMMYVYKYNYMVQRKFSSFSGSIEGGVSKGCSRSIYDGFGAATLKIQQEKCNPEIQVVTYIDQEAIAPEVEKYAEPDYLTAEQKKQLKKREADKIKQQKEREKQKNKIAKEKAKKQKDKEKTLKKKQAEKAKAQSRKEADQAKRKK